MLTKEFFLYNLQLGDGCILVRTAKEIPEDHIDRFSYEVSRVADVRPTFGIYHYKDEGRLQELIKHWKEPAAHFKPLDLEGNIRKDISGEDCFAFEGIPARIVYQFASW